QILVREREGEKPPPIKPPTQVVKIEIIDTDHDEIPSGMPSLSLSGSGQPSSSWNPSLSSGWSGHLSLSSVMPSPSLSLGGQPFSDSGPNSLGHLSRRSGMPSSSLSRSGQPSSSWK